MRKGDLVRNRSWKSDNSTSGESTGIVVNIIQKKVWRTHLLGKAVDWDKVSPEPHAVVMFSRASGTLAIPIVDLEVISENR